MLTALVSPWWSVFWPRYVITSRVSSLRGHLTKLQWSPFAPFLIERAEVCRVTWRTLARSFRATTRARLSALKDALRLAAADVRFAPLRAVRLGKSTGCEREKPGLCHESENFTPRLSRWSPFVSPEGRRVQPWLVRIMPQRKVKRLTLTIAAWQQQVGRSVDWIRFSVLCGSSY